MLLEIGHAWLGLSDTQSSRIGSQDRFQYSTLPCLGMLHIASDYLVFRAFWTSQHFCWTGRQQEDGSQRRCGDGIIVVNTRFLSLPNLKLHYNKFILFFTFITFLWSSKAPRLFFSICDIIWRLFPFICSFHYLLYLKFKNKQSFN